MNYISYIEGSEELLEDVRLLWEELNVHHYNKSLHFKSRYEKMTFDKRKLGLLAKADKGHIKIILAMDTVGERYIGYCISTVNCRNEAEIESIYIKSEYRGHKIGDHFMTASLGWIESFKPVSIVIGVAGGNEDAIPFYEKYGFYTKMTALEKKK